MSRWANQYGPVDGMPGSLQQPLVIGGRCGALASFGEGDEQTCALPKRHVSLGQLHENAAGTRRWSLEYGDDGQPLTGSIKPGTEVRR